LRSEIEEGVSLVSALRGITAFVSELEDDDFNLTTPVDNGVFGITALGFTVAVDVQGRVEDMIKVTRSGD
jgi:hypothetical protein